MSRYRNLKIDQFETEIFNNPEAIILDVRTPAEFAGGHLENAMNVPSIREVLDSLDPAKHYYLHCRVGGRSAIAAQLLVMKGFQNVNNLNDSIENTVLPLISEKVVAA